MIIHLTSTIHAEQQNKTLANKMGDRISATDQFLNQQMAVCDSQPAQYHRHQD